MCEATFMIELNLEEHRELDHGLNALFKCKLLSYNKLQEEIVRKISLNTRSTNKQTSKFRQDSSSSCGSGQSTPRFQTCCIQLQDVKRLQDLLLGPSLLKSFTSFQSTGLQPSTSPLNIPPRLH